MWKHSLYCTLIHTQMYDIRNMPARRSLSYILCIWGSHVGSFVHVA